MIELYPQVSARNASEVQHDEAVFHPLGIERAWAQLIDGLQGYAWNYRVATDSLLVEDGVLGEEFEELCKSLVALLNGPTGRLHGAKLLKGIRRAQRYAGMEVEG